MIPSSTFQKTDAQINEVNSLVEEYNQANIQKNNDEQLYGTCDMPVVPAVGCVNSQCATK
jgi:hypothetical protein